MRVSDPPLTADAIVALLHALTGVDELSHDELKEQSADDHHNEAHSLASHSTKAHAELSDAPADAHHSEAHAAADHSDQSATGAELETLTDGSETALHTHPPLQSAIESDFRNLNAASGDVTYNGFGFQPRALIAVALQYDEPSGHVGIGDVDLVDKGVQLFMTTPDALDSKLLKVVDSAGNQQSGELTAYTSDGYTVTWTKTGTPTGSANFSVLALR